MWNQKKGGFLSLFLFLLSWNGLATEYHAELKPLSSDKEGIVVWDESDDTTKPVVQLKDPKDLNPESPPYFVVLKGKYSRFEEEETLLLGQKELDLSPKGEFSVKIPIEGEENEFQLLSVDKTGQIDKVSTQIYFSAWSELNPGAPLQERPVKKISVKASLGISSTSYRQPQITEFNQWALNLNGVGIYTFVPHKWDVRANANLTLLPFGSSTPGNTIHFVHIAGDGSYQFIRKPSRWKLRALAGYGYLTTAVSSGSFGFGNVNSIRFGSRGEFQIDKKKVIEAYFRFAPIFGKAPILSTSNLELALGADYSMFFDKLNHWLGAMLEISYLGLNIDGMKVHTNTYNLLFTYHF